MTEKISNDERDGSEMFSGLGLRLLIAVLIFSSVVTLILTGVQLYLDYRGDIYHLEQRFKDIESGFVPSLAESLWNIDRHQIDVQLDGLLHLPDVQYIEVVEAGAMPFSFARGEQFADRTIARDIPINCRCGGGDERTVGKLHVELSLDRVYGDLLTRGSVILMTQGIKTFLVSFFLLIVFHRLVTRHIIEAARSMEAGGAIALNRDSPRGEDELDCLANAFNDLSAQHHTALREMEALAAHHKSLIDNMPGRLVRLRYFPDGKKQILSVLGDVERHPVVKDIVEVPPDELPTMFHPDDCDLLFREVPRRLKEAGYSEQRFRVLEGDGKYHWHWVRERVIERSEDGGMITEGLSLDISAEVAAQEAKERSERHFRDLIEALPVGVFVINNDGGVMIYNEAAVAIWGRRPLQNAPHWLNRAWRYPDGTPLPQNDDEELDWVLGADGLPLPADKRLMSMARAQNQVIRGIEMRIRRPDGSVVPLLAYPSPLRDGHGVITGAFNVMIDISEMVEARRQLDLMRFALANIHEATSLSDSNGTILWVNDWNQTIFGYTPQEMVGMNVRDLAVEIPAISWNKHWRDLAENKAMTFEVMNRRKDGSHFPAQVHINYFRHDGGEYNLALLSDITERKRMEEERARLEARLESARKLELLGQLAGGIAHDFNNLLGAIMGFALFIAEDAAPGDPAATHARRILTAGRRGKALIEQILAFSRQGGVKRALFPLAAAIEETRDILGVAIPSSTLLTLDLAQCSAVVEGDRDQIGQVILNLVINADAALQGRPGEIVIAVRRPDVPEAVMALLVSGEAALEAKTWSDPDGTVFSAIGTIDPTRPNVALIVEDHAAGMDETVMRQIFTPFFTTKAKGKGTGLGLAVVQGIVQAHGGALFVKSRPGVGTTIMVILPEAVGVEGVVDRRRVPARVTGAPLTGVHVLLADDDIDFGDMLVIALERKGGEVAASENPIEILEALREDPAPWDVLVTDQTMPGMRGTDLIREAKAIRADLPCILCTGYAEGADAAMDIADAVIGKPIDMDALLETMARLLKRDREQIPPEA